MTNMKAIILMNNGKTVIITSDKGRYNKQTYDSFFEENVKATDNETIILSKRFVLCINLFPFLHIAHIF